MSRESSEQRTCVVCHARFVAVGRQLIKKITCSDECAKIRARQMRRIFNGYGDGRNCAECGVLYCPLGQTNKTFCSDQCRDENVRRRQREFKRRELADPQRREASYVRRRLRRKENPELAKAADKRKWERIKANPDRYAEVRNQSNAHYRANAAEIQAKRRERLKNLPEEKLAELVLRNREYQREYAKHRRNSPRTRDRDAAVYREWRRRQREHLFQVEAAVLLKEATARMAGASPSNPAKRCEICGGPILGKRPNAKTCSPDCQRKRKLSILYPPRPRPCVVCGVIFDRPTCAIICSDECARKRKSQQKQEERR